MSLKNGRIVFQLGQWGHRQLRQCANSGFRVSILIFLLALAVRWFAALDAYPVAGDAAHFVQHGIALANGNMQGFSLYWSQGMIVIAALSEIVGLDPSSTLQWANVLTGSVVCVLLYGIVDHIMRDRIGSLIIALWACVNPKLVQYSITGYSEMSYMLFLYSALILFVRGIQLQRNSLFIWGGLALGVGAYFKALDACVVLGALTLYAGGYSLYFRKHKALISIGVMVAVFAGAILPLCIYTYQQAGVFAPGSKGSNFALGDDWKDSKIVYDVERGLSDGDGETTEGVLSFARAHAGLICKRWIRHMAEVVHLFNSQLFSGGIKLGSLFFGMLLIISGYMWWQHRQPAMYGVLFVCLLTVGMISLCFVHDRLIIPVLPIVLFFTGSGLYHAYRAVRWPLWMRRTAYLLMLLFIAANVRLAVASHENEFFFWRYKNVEYVGKELRKYADESDIIMCQYPHLAIEFYRTNAMAFIEMPYGEIPLIEEFCQKRNVDVVVVSDQFRTHWPIVSLYDDPALAPDNWQLMKTIVVPSRRWDIPEETYLIYSRDPLH